MKLNTNFSYIVTASCKTSAGVYNSAGSLIRTIWSLKPETIGSHTARWDGNDDFGNVATGGPFTIKILSSNVTYTWEGVIGNTSTNLTGHTVLRSTYPPRQLCATHSSVYWALGYGEIWPATWKTNIANPNSKTWINMQSNGGYVQSDFVCSDGINVYWGASDPAIPAHSFVWGTKVSDDSVVSFANGVSLAQGNGVAYRSVIGYVNDPLGAITGLAVQKKGNFLFISRAGFNQLLILNKTTGAVVSTISISNPGQLVVDGNDNLWIAYASGIEKCLVNADGTLTISGISIPLTNAGGLAINPSNTLLIAADMANQQVKGYSLNGTLQWTLGTGVSYVVSAAIQNNKFYWRDLRGQYPTFLCFLPDGSFYVGDGQNWRIQHFAADRSFIDSISFIGNQYIVSVDLNNPASVFAGFMEFKIDYTKPLNSSWTLVNNWRASCPAQYISAITNPVTLSNKKTYCFLQISGPAKTVAELVPGGAVRITNVVFSNNNFNPVQNYIDSDGTLVNLSETAGFTYGTQFQIKRYPLAGFDSSNNPIWARSPSVITTTPVLGSFGVKGNTAALKTTAGNYIHFDPFRASSPVTDPNATGQGYHIGAMPEGGSVYKWGSAPSTNRDTYTGPYPGQGNYLSHYFDSGNGVNNPGGYTCVLGNHVLWSYHGEGWKGGQTNLYYHIFDNNIGLPAGSFGTNIYLFPNNTNDAGNLGKGRLEAIPGGAGNSLLGQLVSVNGTVYLWHGDESYHGGTHRWRLDNLDSISVQTAVYSSIQNVEKDLLAGLVRGSDFMDGVAGWNRNPKADYNNTTGKMICAIGNKNYDLSNSPSLSIVGSLLTAPGSFYVSRSLGNSIRLQSWIFSTDVLYDANIPSDNSDHGQMLQILDKNGLIIVQIYAYGVAGGTTQIRVNGIIIASGTNPSQALFDLVNAFHSWTKLTISDTKGILTVSYGNYAPVTVPALDARVDISAPATLRLYFFTSKTVVQSKGMSIAIQKTKFIANGRFLSL